MAALWLGLKDMEGARAGPSDDKKEENSVMESDGKLLFQSIAALVTKEKKMKTYHIRNIAIFFYLLNMI